MLAEINAREQMTNMDRVGLSHTGHTPRMRGDAPWLPTASISSAHSSLITRRAAARGCEALDASRNR
jgi:hypothetical protein